MNDIDHDLREMFRRHETDVAGPPFAPPQIVKRVRKRQFRTVSAALLGVVVILAAGVGISSQLRGVDRKIPIAPTPSQSIPPAPDVGTANLGGVTFSVPHGWYLSTYGRGHSSLGYIIALTNFAPPLTSADPCSGMPPDGLLLVVDPGVSPHAGDHAPAWPVQLEDTASSEVSCGAVHLDAVWSSGDRALSATAAIGAAATNADRETLLHAFGGLTFEDSGRGVALSAFGYCSSADFDAYLVLASGSLGDQLWTLAVRPACDQISLETSYEGNGGVRMGDLKAPDDLTLAEVVNDGSTYLLGAVPADVARVVVAPTGAAASDAALYESGFRVDGARVLLAPLDGVRTGTLTTYDSGGSVLRRVRFAPGCWDRYQCGEPVQPGETIAASQPGESLPWTLRQVDGEIELLGDGGNVLGSVAGTPDPLNVATVTIPSPDGVDLVFGVASQDTSLVAVYPSRMGEPWAAQTVVLADGRIVFWIEPLHGDESAVASFDPACDLLAIVDPLSGDPLTVTPRHGCSDMRGIW